MSDDNDLHMSVAIGDIATERSKQVNTLGRTRDRDDTQNRNGEMASAAAMYAFASTLKHPQGVYERDARIPEDRRAVTTINHLEHLWPRGWSAPNFSDQRRHLVIAGALIVAEIERIDRAEAKAKAHQEMIERERRPLPVEKAGHEQWEESRIIGGSVPMKHMLD